MSAVDPKSLPVRGYADRIVEAVRSNSVTIVIGETGSGKTTQISQVRSIVTELSRLCVGVCKPVQLKWDLSHLLSGRRFWKKLASLSTEE